MGTTNSIHSEREGDLGSEDARSPKPGTTGKERRLQKNLRAGQGVAPTRSRIAGIDSPAELSAFLPLMKTPPTIRRGDPVRSASGKHFTVLLAGLACTAIRHEDGTRQILAFLYPGDFIALHDQLSPTSAKLVEVQALSNCSVGTIDRHVMEQAMRRRPELGQALWRAALIEASVLRQRLVTARRPAQHRVAHLLCEQLFRLRAGQSIIPLSQIEIAEAVGLSVVHTNRVLQELRQLGVLSTGRSLRVLDEKRLRELAAFDSRYLEPGACAARWEVRIEE